ncbi:maltase A3-like [Planococcus citri]|uniref:maltase A3-like n=1 Tax=Planococcus citri TaxID=170843 RepID=UPI0031F76C67
MKLLNLLLVFQSVLLYSECALPKKTLEWWQTSLIYQIYPRSFKDSDGDGVGDLKGISQKLTYLKNLGVEAIWLSPICASPMVDFGYDISNYREIEPVFGTMEDFENLLRKAHHKGLKVILDYVPNHTSDKHDWFQKSVKKIKPYTHYYIWKNAKYVKGKRHPPNNWISAFGKSAWEWNEERGQYYLHQFAVQQPDLNYRNPVVYEEMKNILTYWLDKGVDGFRLDAVNYLYEDKNYPDEPLSNKPNVAPEEYDYLDHIYSVNQEETFRVLQDWRAILEKYSKRGRKRFMMSEAYADLNTVMRFYGTKEEPAAHLPFNFLLIDTVKRSSNATHVAQQIQSWYSKMPSHGWANWVIGNHDNSRPASRYGQYLIDGLHMIQLLLPGTPIVYNGDELGMEDTFIRWDQTVDPRALYAGPYRYLEFSRDVCRTPFHWDDSENAGFTTGLNTWLPVNPGYWKVNVQEQSKISNRITHLQVFKELARLRKNIVFQKGDFHMDVIDEWILVFVRTFVDHSTFIVTVNFGSEIIITDLQKIRPSLPDTLKVVIPSVNSDHYIGEVISTNKIKLRPKAGIVMTTSEVDMETDDNMNNSEISTTTSPISTSTKGLNNSETNYDDDL